MWTDAWNDYKSNGRIFDSGVFPLVALFTGWLSGHVCLSWLRKMCTNDEIKAHLAVKHRTSFLQVHKSDRLLRWAAAALGFLFSSHLKLEPEPLASGCWMLPVESQGHLFPPWNRLDKVRAVIFNWFHSHFTHEGKCWWNQLVTQRKTGAMWAGRVNILCKGMWNEVISAAWEEVANVNVARWLIPGITAATSD